MTPHRRWTPYVWVLAAAGVVVVLAAVVFVAPRLLYPPLPASRFAGVAPDKRIELETNRLKLQDDARATLLQGLAGGILLLGAYLTWRQLGITREGQITDRYTKAVDQLGHAELDVRLGGIYALERIARDSPADRATIGEVLTAFVRGHSPWPPSAYDDDQPAATKPIDEILELQVRAADVQASLAVLGRGGFAPPAGSRDRLDLHGVDLRVANLAGAHLEQAYLAGAHLEKAELRDAHLEGADLRGAHLEGATLLGAHMERAILNRARLEDALLQDASLEGAQADRGTRWPDWFNAREALVIVLGEDAAAS
jgi:pentapeptide repeat protein